MWRTSEVETDSARRRRVPEEGIGKEGSALVVVWVVDAEAVLLALFAGRRRCCAIVMIVEVDK